ncbi:MAG: EAL domain-containing protein [Oscillospiraceae bacterium]
MALLVLVSILLAVFSFSYYHQVQKTVSAESSGYLQEISKLLAENVSRVINDNISVLGTVFTVMQTSEASTFDQFRPIALEQKKYWNYQNFFVVDENGVAYDSDGNSTMFDAEMLLRDVIVMNKPSIAPSITVDGRDSAMFAIPVSGLTLDGIEVRALAASYSLSTFDRMLSMTAFEGEAYAHIIRKDGSVVIRSTSEKARQTGYNILNSLADADFGHGESLDCVKNGIALGNNGIATFDMDGLTEYMAYTPIVGQDWSLLVFVPVSVVSEKSLLLLRLTIMFCTLISISFTVLIVFLALSFYRNKHSLEQVAYVDPTTGGNTILKFYEEAQRLLAKPAGRVPYAMIYMNIKKFKVLNEQFGKKNCDQFLRSAQYAISHDLTGDECVGRLGADNFCILLRYFGEEALTERFSKWRSEAALNVEENGSLWLPHQTEFGIFVIDDPELPLPHMIDRAKLALTENSNRMKNKIRYAIYNEEVRRILLREKHMEDRMEDALENHEFEVYLQPKYNTQTERIGGAEALVRWNSPKDGMIYPDEFIPLFEKNGFVVQVDLFVFEEVCRTLERWTREGIPPIKISANCSRNHLKSQNFLDNYRRIAEKYILPPGVLELELTESAVFEDVNSLTSIIQDIHDLGFSCSMDDFGSGYSSLNLIRDIPVDTLKLDKVFFNNVSYDTSRTESVVGSIITMAKALNMSTVAEGVEERVQVDMLKKLNCDYIQGYYFARPMPIKDFEKLLSPEGQQR